MIERGARALCTVRGQRYEAWWAEKFGDDKDDDPWPQWGQVEEGARQEFYEEARAVIESLREPTDAMVRAAQKAQTFSPGFGPDISPGQDKAKWQAMIDEILR